MKRSLRITVGLWLERFRITHPVLLRFSHVAPDGRRRYLNRMSRTFAATTRRTHR